MYSVYMRGLLTPGPEETAGGRGSSWSNCACTRHRGTVLPGFMMSRGSSARLIIRIRSTASPCSWARTSSLCQPMPCSPVHVPPMEIARTLTPFGQSLGAFALRRIGTVEQDDEMKVAVADVPQNGRGQATLLNVDLGLEDAVGQSRYGNAGIGRKTGHARFECQRRVVRVVPRLPPVSYTH